MPRERMVTRTVEVNTFEVLTLNTDTAEAAIQEFTLGAIAPGADPLKLLQKTYETPVLKLCSVKSSRYDTVLYGMTEREFISRAKVLPPRAGAEGGRD